MNNLSLRAVGSNKIFFEVIKYFLYCRSGWAAGDEAGCDDGGPHVGRGDDPGPGQPAPAPAEAHVHRGRRGHRDRAEHGGGQSVVII